MMDSARITYDSTEMLRIINTGLDRINAVRYDSRYKMLLGESVIEKLNRWDNVIRMQIEEPLTIVVCGEFKRGKSSLINAILGEDVATTDITTETITINKICYGEHSNEIILSGGKRITLKDEELKSGRLTEILKTSGAGSNQLILKRPIDILKKFTIIDTPGLGDTFADFSNDIAQALKMADAVIYVFSVSYPLSIQEQYFIRTAIVPQKYTELILVGNHADAIEDIEDYQKILQVAKKRITDILPDEEPLFVSALAERCRQLEKPCPNPDMQEILNDNFALLRDKLNELLEVKSECVIPDRIARLSEAMQADIRTDISAITKGLVLNSRQMQEKIDAISDNKDELSKKQAEIFETIDRKCEISSTNAAKWIDTLIDILETDAAGLEGKVSTDDIKRFYTLFCVDTLQEAFGKCAENYLSAIYDEFNNISPELAGRFSVDSGALSPKFIFEVNNNTFTGGDKVAFVGSVVADAMGMSLIENITDYIGGIVREHEIAKKSPDYIKSIRDQLRGLHLTAVPSLSKAYREMAAKAKEQIASYFENENQILDNEAAQLIAVSHKDDASKEAIRAAVEYLEGLLKDICVQ